MKRLPVLVFIAVLVALIVSGGSTSAQPFRLGAATGTPSGNSLPGKQPVIHATYKGKNSDGVLTSSCWPPANPSDQPCTMSPNAQPAAAIAVANGDEITFVLDPATPAPHTFTATLPDDQDATGKPRQTDLTTTKNIFKVDNLTAGQHTLQVQATYPGDTPDSNFVEYTFTLDVQGAGAATLAATANATTSAATTSAATVNATVSATRSATSAPTRAATVQAAQLVTAAATASATQAATAIATAAVPTVQATQSATAVPTQVATQAVVITATTPALPTSAATIASTAAPTIAATIEAISTASATPTETATMTPTATAVASQTTTNTPTNTATDTATSTLQPTTAVPTATNTSTATATAVPATLSVGTSATPPIISLNTASNDNLAPDLVLQLGGKSYSPVALTATILSSIGVPVSITRPMTTNAERIAALPGSVAQISFKGPRPVAVRATLYSADGSLQLVSQPLQADNLVLYGITTTPGTYVLTIDIVWPAGQAIYYYRLTVNG